MKVSSSIGNHPSALRKQVPKTNNKATSMKAKTNYRTYVSKMAESFSRWRAFGRVAAAAVCAVIGPSAGLLAAEVTTDQLDYSPGATAIISGSGFGSGETVVLQVLHADGTESTGADHDPWSVAADVEGAFTTSWHVCEDDCLGSTLQLIAAGQTSGEFAETFFTDAVFAIRLATVTSLFHFQSRWWAYPVQYRQHISRTFEALDARLGLVD